MEIQEIKDVSLKSKLINEVEKFQDKMKSKLDEVERAVYESFNNQLKRV